MLKALFKGMADRIGDGWAGLAALSLLAAILRQPKSWDLAFLTLYRALSAFAGRFYGRIRRDHETRSRT